MKVEDIVKLWDKDSEIDETELAVESTKIPQIHNKYLKIYMGERAIMFRQKAEYRKTKRKLMEYYLGEMDHDELDELGREQFYKKLLKNEVDTYIESDDMMIDITLKIALQEEKLSYLESILKSLNNRGFQIKNAIDWAKLSMGA